MLTASTSSILIRGRLEYSDDFAWLGQVRRAARNRFHDTKLGDENLARKVRQIIDEHVSASGFVTLTETISILSPAFDEHLENLSSDDARASEMAHAMTHQISEKASENPVFYGSLREQLNEIIEARKAERLSAAEQLRKLYPVREALRSGAQSEAKRLGLTDTAFAFFKLVTDEGVTLDEEDVRTLAGDLEGRVRRSPRARLDGKRGHLAVDKARRETRPAAPRRFT